MSAPAAARASSPTNTCVHHRHYGAQRYAGAALLESPGHAAKRRQQRCARVGIDVGPGELAPQVIGQRVDLLTALLEPSGHAVTKLDCAYYAVSNQLEAGMATRRRHFICKRRLLSTRWRARYVMLQIAASEAVL
jgi:hypothetical protein